MAFVLDGADAVAAKFMFTGESGRGEDHIRTDGAEDIVLKLCLHEEDKNKYKELVISMFQYDKAIIHAFELRRLFHTDYFPTFM